MKKLRGYIFSRPFFNERVPQHIQNTVLRDYCEKKNFFFLLSFTEYTMKNSSLMLESIIKNLKKIDGIVFYSFFQMPVSFSERKNIYNKILKEKKELHFVVEKIIFKDINQINQLEEMISIKSVSDNDNKSIDIKEKYLK
tara:strand:+ start:1348 stop:1767 length:420 start_codon:yes stop_codon:yes gene_type:complete